MGLVGLMGCRMEKKKEKPAPAFPEPLKKEEENSQRCLGTVGAALVEAQGVRGRENSSKTLNKPDQSFGSGQGEQLPPGPSRFLTHLGTEQKMPPFF